MRNLKLLFFLVSLLVIVSADHLLNHPEKGKVYICDTDGAKKYHLKAKCEGLKKCEGKILKVTKEEAFEKGKKTLCGWED